MIISGHVQGVGFRYTAREKAISLHLTGWVRNKIEGTVEMEVLGTRENVEQFIKQTKKGFHDFMRVDHVEVNKLSNEKDYQDFQIRS